MNTTSKAATKIKTNNHVDFSDFYKKPPKIRNEFTARYYGTRQLEIFPPSFWAYVEQTQRFIDVTAGGGRFLYNQVKQGYPVGGNDRCFYSYAALKSVLVKKKQEDIQSYLEKWWNKLHPEKVVPVDGVFSNIEFLKDKSKTPTTEVKNYIDGICEVAKNNLLVLYSIGKTLQALFSFRGYRWCSVTNIKIPSCKVTTNHVFERVMKGIWETYLYNQSLGSLENEILNMDALQAIKSFEHIKGSIVYADPAWPWSKKYGASKNPYSFYTDDLSNIIQQKQSSKIRFWENTDPKEKILDEIRSWVLTSLDRGAKYFILSGQDTNYPPFPDIREYFRKYTPVIDEIVVDDYSKNASRVYKTMWLVFGNK